MRKILLSEGSSLTARETLTALKNCGYSIDILSSSKFPSTAFSIWKHRLISTADVNKQPQKYIGHVSELLKSGKHEAILPTHETAWLLSESLDYLPPDFPIPVAEAESFHKIQGKIDFARQADALSIPQPKWQLVTGRDSISIPYPYWLKADFGTAGRSVCKVGNPLEAGKGIDMLSTGSNQIMAQESIAGEYGQVLISPTS